MRNVMAIAGRELRSYFASPIAYVVIGFFALVFGQMYVGVMTWFVQQGTQMGMGMGPQSLNVNQQMVRPLLLNMTVVFLFLLPLVTMRTYAEEKRSGTIELLLTSPLTDVQIVLGKFLGAMALYAAMLVVTLLHFGLLFVFGNPDWKPLAVAYLGLLLFGGCFISMGLFISSLTKNQIVAGAATFGVFLLLWVIDWIGQSLGPTGESILKYLSMTGHLDDFVKGVIDTKHLFYYCSFIAFGLFLTVRSRDTARRRGSAGMAKRIFNVIGWLGTALVFVAVGIKIFRSEWAQYATWAAWAGLAMVLAYMASQWRETAAAMNQRQTKLGTIALSSVVLVLGLLVALNYLASRRNHRWDLTANQQFSLSPQTRQILEKLDAPRQEKVFDK